LRTVVNGINIAVSLILAGVVAGLAFVALPIFGNQALIVRSGSMRPTVPVGGFVVVRPQEHILSPLVAGSFGEGGQPALITPLYNVGDIVAFRNEAKPKIITTHRIVGVEVKNGKVFYRTKGDANNTPDNSLVAEENIVGKTWLLVPFIGKLFAFTKSNIGFPLLVIFPALLVIIFESINIFRELKKQREISQNQFSSRISVAGFKILIPLAVSVIVFQNSFAYFSDTATSINNTFHASETFPHVVINEVYYDICSPAVSCGVEPDNEWVELYNQTNSTVDISGWTLTDNNKSVSIPPGSLIAANSFVVITPAESTWAFWPSVPESMRIVLGSEAAGKIGNGLSNTGDRLILKNSSGTTIDAISYGNDTNVLNPSISSVSSGHSIERDPDGVDTGKASDFVDRTIPTPGT